MKILCHSNNPNKVSSDVPDFNFGLIKKKEYFVIGLLLTNNQFWFLIDENSKPNFYPLQLFTITDILIPPNWNFKVYDECDGVYPFNKSAIWGYKELCVDLNHYEEIINRIPKALNLYFNEKIKVLKYYENNINN